MVIIILVCIGFGTSFHITNAYGMTGLTILLFALLTSSGQCHDCHYDASYNRHVRRLGIHLHHPPGVPPLLWSHRRCLLGL